MTEKITRGTREYRFAILALFCGSLATFGTEHCVQPIIPVFTDTFHVEPAIASLAVSFGTGGMATAMFIIAIFAKRLPRKIIMTAGLIVAASLAVMMSFSNRFEPILALRLIQGMMLAGFPAMAIAYINEEFDPAIIGSVTGIYIAGTSIGGLAGRLILSALTDQFDWRIALMILGCLYVGVGILFMITLPKPRHIVDRRAEIAKLTDFKVLLHNMKLVGVYIIAAFIMGSFVCTYNFISYVLLAPPYSLTQTQVGLVFFLYLIGTLASAVMGRLSDRIGNGRSLIISIVVMLGGVLVSIVSPLLIKLIGIAMITYGFFGAHSAACSWAGKLDDSDKARISAMYMLFYYCGASIIGTTGGKFLSAFGWNGIVYFLTAILIVALGLSIALLRADTPTH